MRPLNITGILGEGDAHLQLFTVNFSKTKKNEIKIAFDEKNQLQSKQFQCFEHFHQL